MLGSGSGAEPVGVCNINQERAEVDSSFLQGWFEEAFVEFETDPNVVYRTVDDYTNLLSMEEQQSLENQQHEIGIELDSLSAAMNEDLPTESFNNQEQDLDELLQFLHEKADEVIAPEAYAGENQTISLNNGFFCKSKLVKPWILIDSGGIFISGLIKICLQVCCSTLYR